MITLTRMNQQPVVVNVDVIAYVEGVHDTWVTLTNGDRMHVRETVAEVIERAVAYRRRVAGGDLSPPVRG